MLMEINQKEERVNFRRRPFFSLPNLRKQPTFSRRHFLFPREITSAERAQKIRPTLNWTMLFRLGRDKSRYFAQPRPIIANCSKIVLSFDHKSHLERSAKQSVIFTQERLQEREKSGFIYGWVKYYLQPNTVGRHCAWADHYLQAVIGHVVGCRPMKKKKNLHRMIIRFTFYLLPLLGSPASSSPRDINTDTDYLKTARKGGGHKGTYLQCF